MIQHIHRSLSVSNGSRVARTCHCCLNFYRKVTCVIYERQQLAARHRPVECAKLHRYVNDDHRTPSFCLPSISALVRMDNVVIGVNQRVRVRPNVR